MLSSRSIRVDSPEAPRSTRGLLVAIERIRGRSSQELVAASIVALIWVGIADWWTGPGVNVTVGYAAVTILAAFSISLRFGLALSVMVASWSWVVAAFHPDATLAAPTLAFNATARLLFFFMLAAGAAASRSVVDELDRLAGTDPLTGLFNRRALVSALDRAVALAERSGKPITIAYLDLRKLKQVNDQLGHKAGDELIRSLAAGLKNGLRRGDVMARVGGDEFVVLLPSVGATAATALIRRILEAPNVPEANAGLVEFQLAALGPTPDANEMIRQADEAMYYAKVNGLPLHVETSDPVGDQPSPVEATRATH